MTMHRLIITSFLLLVLLSNQSTFAASRIALVVGNGHYPSLGALRNPPNDARLMATTLRSLGFDVIERINSNQKDMRKAIKLFGNQLEAAGPDAAGLFYFAGHGVQVRGENFMIPTNVDIQDEADVRIEAVSANAVQENMAFAGNNLNIIILDACRNNPFKRSFRSGTRGLARMDASKGTLIAYATAPGDVAADGRGDNSPYTEALANALKIPGLSIEQLFKHVRNQVVSTTNSAQVPWEASSLTGADFYFSGSSTAPQIVAPLPIRDRETLFWQSVKDSKFPADFQAYLEQYPNGTFSGLARVRVDALTKQTIASKQSAAHPYDGNWNGWLRTYGGLFNSPVEATFTVTVNDSRLRGTVHMYGESRTIKADVDPSGALKNGRLDGSMQGYDLRGTLEQGLGDGALMGWKLEYKMKRSSP
jgi:hypothetical protein